MANPISLSAKSAMIKSLSENTISPITSKSLSKVFAPIGVLLSPIPNSKSDISVPNGVDINLECGLLALVFLLSSSPPLPSFSWSSDKKCTIFGWCKFRRNTSKNFGKSSCIFYQSMLYYHCQEGNELDSGVEFRLLPCLSGRHGGTSST